MGSGASKAPARRLDFRDDETTTSHLSDVHRSLSPRSIHEHDNRCASYTVRCHSTGGAVGRERAETAPAEAEVKFTGARVHSLDDVRGIAFRANSLPTQSMLRGRGRSASYCALSTAASDTNSHYSEPLDLNKTENMLDGDYVDICKYLSEQDDNPGLQMRYRRRSRAGSKTSIGSIPPPSSSGSDKALSLGSQVPVRNEIGNGDENIDGGHLVFDLDGHQRHVEDRIPATLDEESVSEKTNGEQAEVCALKQAEGYNNTGVHVEKEGKDDKTGPMMCESAEGTAKQPGHIFNPFKQKQERRRHQRSKSDTLNASENTNNNSESKQANISRPVFQLGADHDDDLLNVDFEAKQRELWLMRRARRVTIHEVSEELEEQGVGSPRRVAGPVAEIAPMVPMVQANMQIGNRRRVTVSALPSQPIRISTTNRFI